MWPEAPAPRPPSLRPPEVTIDGTRIRVDIDGAPFELYLSSMDLDRATQHWTMTFIVLPLKVAPRPPVA